MNIEFHIEAMKFREEEQRRLADTALTKAQTIQKNGWNCKTFWTKPTKKKNSAKKN